MRKVLSLPILVLAFLHPIQAQNSPTVGSAYAVFGGSPPPLGGVYRCIRQLEGSPYSETRTTECLDSIRATGRFLSSNVTRRLLENGSIELVFHLVAPTLEIAEIEYELNPERRGALEAFLQERDMTVRVGDPYDTGKQGLVLQNIEQFFSSQETREGIASKIMLDYRTLTARIHYRFFDGPVSPRESSNLVENSLCSDRIRELNQTDIDDFAPLTLVENEMRTRAFTCFDESLAREDESRLRETGLFQSVQIHVSGEQGARRLTVSIRGKPLKVRRVGLVGYGAIPHGSIDEIEELPLRANSIYMNSSTREAAGYLAERYYAKHQDKQVAVIPEVRRVNSDNVDVVFSILVYDQSELYLDGELVHRGDSSDSY